MIGGIEETSASFEARPAPRSYPTPIRRHMQCSKLQSISTTARVLTAPLYAIARA
jgi:hypothetical protein